MEVIYGAAFFFIGFMFSEYMAEQKRKDLIKVSNQIFEINSYIVLGQLGEMHDLGLKALGLAYEKCLEVDQTQKEEFEEIIKVYDRKMEEFGNLYMKSLKKVLTGKSKYNTYKQVKENFKNLINDNNSQETKDA